MLNGQQTLPAESPANHPRSKYWQAQLTIDRGNPARAFDYFLYDPNSLDPLHQAVAAEIFYAGGEVEKAIRIRERLNDYRALLQIARHEKERGAVENAIAAYRAATEADLATGEAPFELAEFFDARKQYDQAEEWYLKALEREPDRISWRLALADSVRDGGDLERAIKIYEETTRLAPDFALAYHQLAWAYRLNNQQEEALFAIQITGQLLDTPTDWYLSRAAAIYEWAGETRLAIDLYQQLLELNSNNSEAIRALERLVKP